MTLEAINLDNTVTILSYVDHFDFNWHINYVYADDVAPLLPAGTVLHMISVHDNTAANPRNPVRICGLALASEASMTWCRCGCTSYTWTTPNSNVS